MLKKGTPLAGQFSFNVIRDPKKEFSVLINTSNGLSSVKRLEPIDDGNSGAVSVGTIVASVLNFDSFSKLTKSDGPTGTWSPVKSKWAPCDGRSVAGSKYQVYWAGALGPNVPDLRGVFMRGLNQFDLAEPARVSDTQKNFDEPGRNVVQGDAVGPHQHKIDIPTGYMLDLGIPNHPPVLIFVGDRPAWDNKTGNLTATKDGLAFETRPKNISVYYYIRIN
jgi:hypothetical protein